MQKALKIISCFFLMIFTFYSCKDGPIASDYYEVDTIAIHKNGEGFAGSQACAACHIDIYRTHLETTHFNTTAIADSTTVKGSFVEGENTFLMGNRVRFTMTVRDSGLYQHANFERSGTAIFDSKIDVVIGSGAKGQSYLNWQDDKLYQLQASYYTPTDSWTTSPGKISISSSRPAKARCLECHMTYAKVLGLDGRGNRYDTEQMIYGIDCERCHGPSAKHVGYHQKNPEATTSKYTFKYAELSRQQRLDACALCHSGVRKQMIQPPFSFVTGDNLAAFSTPDYKDEDTPTLDVHGNQYGLLTSSTCFKSSVSMDCATCHNPHKNERGNTAIFNQKCVSCHRAPKTTCNLKNQAMLGDKATDCISCHMPVAPSKTMVMQIDSMATPVQVRTHLIAVYPEKDENEL